MVLRASGSHRWRWCAHSGTHPWICVVGLMLGSVSDARDLDSRNVQECSTVAVIQGWIYRRMSRSGGSRADVRVLSQTRWRKCTGQVIIVLSQQFKAPSFLCL